jgi:hypothetical protein
MKSYAIVAALATCAALAAVGLPGAARAADAPDVATQSVALAPFTKLVIDGSADVTLVQGTGHAMTVEAPARQLSRVRIDASGDTLTLEIRESRNWWSWLVGAAGKPPKLTLTFRELSSVRAAGAVKLRTGALRADNLALGVSGSATINLAGLDVTTLAVSGSGAVKAEVAGHAATQTVAISGAGDYRAAALKTDRATVSVSGAGKVVVDAQKSLDVDISGAGVVEYVGSPTVRQRISGAGSVRRHGADAAPAPAPSHSAHAPWLAFSAAPPRRRESSPA